MSNTSKARRKKNYGSVANPLGTVPHFGGFSVNIPHKAPTPTSLATANLNKFLLGPDALDVVAKVKYTPIGRSAVPVLELLSRPKRRYEMIGQPILLRNRTRKEKGAISKVETFQDIVDVWCGEIRNVAVAHSPILRVFSERSESTKIEEVRTSGPLDTNVCPDAAACERAVKEAARILNKVPLEFDEATVFDEDRHSDQKNIRMHIDNMLKSTTSKAFIAHPDKTAMRELIKL